MRACPAGPIVPATVELYLLSSLLMLDPVTLRLKAPRFVPGRGSSVTPSPSRSEKKISAASPVDNGRKRELARELLTRVPVFTWKPHGRSTRTPKPLPEKFVMSAPALPGFAAQAAIASSIVAAPQSARVAAMAD